MKSNDIKLIKGLRYIKTEFTVRKIISSGLLIATLVFILMQSNNFLISKGYLNDELIPNGKDDIKAELNDPSLATDEITKFRCGYPTDNRISVNGTNTIRQTFTAKDKRLDRIKLIFSNPSGFSASGSVQVMITDTNNKKICSSKLNTSMIAHNDITIFDFNGDTKKVNSNGLTTQKITTVSRQGVKVKKNNKYILTIKTRDVKSEDGVYLYLSDKQYKNNDTLYINGKDKGSTRLYADIQYRHFPQFVFAFFICLLLLTIAFIMLPMKKFSEMLEQKYRKKIDLDKIILRIMFILTPFMCYFALEKVAGYKISSALYELFSLDGILNIIIIGFVWWLFYAVFNNTKITIIISTITTLLFGMVNYLLIIFRDCPLIATDFTSLGTAMDVAASYTLAFNKSVLWLITICMIYFCVALSRKSYKGIALKRRIAVLVILAFWGCAGTYMFTGTNILKNNKIFVSGNVPKISYQHHGYALCFYLTINSSKVKKPHGYSVEKVEKLTEKYKSDEASKQNTPTKTNPNIIAVMNESYSDLKVINDFKTSKSYMPFYNSLHKNTIKGTLHSSVYGGGTADTEFEFLTGNTMQFMAFRSVPYTYMLKEKTPSLTYALKSQGYGGNIAFHPGMANSYNRNKVYPVLGFDKFITQDDIKNPEYIRSFISDKEDYRQVIKQYEKYKYSGKKNPFYMFNVTIQNHGGYKISDGAVDKELTITDSNLRQEEAEQYLNLVKKSDEATKELVSYFSSVSDPTVIVFFGDHQPKLENEFYNALYGKSASKLTLEEIERKYRVPVMIWANYSIKEKNDLDISANYLSSYLMEVTGGKQTGYNKYLNNLRKKIPVITEMCYKGNNGRTYAPEQKSKYTKLLKQYQNIEYNNLIDYKNRVNKFFYLKN